MSQVAIAAPALVGTVLQRPCGVELMQAEWEEGFVCVRLAGHDGPHRDTGFEGTDENGRGYVSTCEWVYV